MLSGVQAPGRPLYAEDAYEGGRQCLTAVFQFDDEDTDFTAANILHAVRRQGIKPLCRGQLSRAWELPAVKKNVAILVATDEVAPTQQMRNPRPAVAVHGHQSARWNVGVNHPHAIVF